MKLNAAVKHFAANIQSIDLSPPSGIVKFGAPPLDRNSFRDALYVRSVALPLWKAIEDDSSWGFVVSGDEGCGKSHWLMWLLIWQVSCDLPLVILTCTILLSPPLSQHLLVNIFHISDGLGYRIKLSFLTRVCARQAGAA